MTESTSACPAAQHFRAHSSQCRYAPLLVYSNWSAVSSKQALLEKFFSGSAYLLRKQNAHTSLVTWKGSMSAPTAEETESHHHCTALRLRVLTRYGPLREYTDGRGNAHPPQGSSCDDGRFLGERGQDRGVPTERLRIRYHKTKIAGAERNIIHHR